MFSPWYKYARRHGGGDPLDHCSMHVALYGTTKKRWAMTEHGRQKLRRGADFLQIGHSTLRWDGSTLTAELDEITAPLPRRVRGTIRLLPAGLATRLVSLDGAGKHFWAPIAPTSRVEVSLSQPSLSWSGAAYCDTNFGAAPLEEGFRSWDWCRAPLLHGTAVLYTRALREGGTLATALHYAPDGHAEEFSPPPRVRMQDSFWRMKRETGVDPGEAACVVQSLTDAPFYNRSVVRTHVCGEAATAMHESLSLDRFVNPAVQLMLPFKAPRAFW